MPIDEPDVPHPPRFRWLIRLTITYILFIALIVAGWYYAERKANARLQAEIARLRAAGQPVLAADFNALPKIPDEDNAALVLKQAMNFKFTRRQERWEADINYSLRLSDAQRATLRSFPADYAANLKAARDARQLKQADWGQTYVSPLMNSMLPSLSPVRELANLLGYAATAHHLDGDDAEAIECVRDVLHVANMVDIDGRNLVEHLVSTGISAKACDLLDEFAMELGIDSPAPPLRHASTRPSTRPARPASRRQVQALIAELLDERILAGGLVQAMQGEQAMQIDTIDWMARTYASPTILTGTGRGNSPFFAMTAPMFRNSAARMSGRMSARVIAAREASYPAAGTKMPMSRDQYFDGASPPLWATQIMERILEPSLTRVFQKYFQQIAERRAAAIKLAIRLYQFDHDGRLPDTLEALVPNYLPAVPADPFMMYGEPMRFAKSVKIGEIETPAVYSVAEDARDQGASTQPASSRATKEFWGEWSNRFDRLDLVYPLKLPPLQDPPPPDPDQLPEAVDE